MRIFVDAGHNHDRYDTGATGNGLKEQNITYPIAIKLGNLFKSIGYEIMYSRNNLTDNVGISSTSSINLRYTMANNWKADYFISIHCNASINHDAYGTETLVYQLGGVAEKLAQFVQSALVDKLGSHDRGIVPRTNVGVIKRTRMPAILVETAFIDYASDAKILVNKQDDIAQSIFEGFCKFLGITAPKPIETKPTATKDTKYTVVGETHIIEIDPSKLWAAVVQCSNKKIVFDNCINGIFFMNQAVGGVFPQGMLVNAGRVLSNYQTHQKPVATLIIHSSNSVEMKYVSDISKEKAWFAASGYGVYPKITSIQEGFIKDEIKKKDFTDVTRSTNRPIIGYRKSDNKIVIAVRENSDAKRANETAKNLLLDFAISLDAGGSTFLRVNGEDIIKGDGRTIYNIIGW